MRARTAALIGSGGAAAMAFAFIAFRQPALGSAVFLAAAGVAVASYGVTLVLCHPVRPSVLVLAALVLLTIAMRVPLAAMDVGDRSDIFRYIWDARVQRAGLSPYAVIPNDPAVAHIHTDTTRRMNNMNVTSPYPAGAQLFFRGVTAVSESARAFKATLVVCDLAIAALLVFWLRSAGRNPLLALAYAWNPLVVLEVAHSGHLDVVGALAVLVAAVALSRGHRALTVMALATGIAVKFLPIVLVPLLWRRVRLWHAALGAAVLAAAYAPLLNAPGDVSLGSFPEVLRRFRFNGPVFKLIAFAAGPWTAAAAGLGAGLLTAAALGRSRFRDDPAAWAWPMAAALIAAPIVYPWYLLWLAPFFVSRLSSPLIVWSVAILPVYLAWARARVDGVWAVPTWLGLVEYGVLAVAIGWLFWNSRMTIHSRDRRSIREPKLRDAAAVRVFPPAIPLAAILCGVFLDRLWPLDLAWMPDAPLRYWIGGAIIVAANLGLGFTAIRLMRSTGQSENPWKPTTEIVAGGPYRFTRNPMYLQMVLMCAGLGIVLANTWILLLTPLCVWGLFQFVIRHEEAYLERKFGEGYLAYTRRVRRWL